MWLSAYARRHIFAWHCPIHTCQSLRISQNDIACMNWFWYDDIHAKVWVKNTYDNSFFLSNEILCYYVGWYILLDKWSIQIKTFKIFTQKYGKQALSPYANGEGLVQSDLDIFGSSTYTKVYIDSVCGQWRPWSASTYAQLIRACIVCK